MAKWDRGPPTWLPPYKPEEILQSLSGHNFNISKVYQLKILGGRIKWGTLPTDNFFRR